MNEEINLVCKTMKNFVSVDKVNIGSLGNIVPQLHIHVIGRLKTDRAWPGAIWGTSANEEFNEELLHFWIDKFNMDFSEELMKDSHDDDSEYPTDNPFEKIDSDMDEEMLKDIYKKIAVKVHPDKKHGDEEKFKVLNRANKNKDYGAMLEMADELNLGKVFPINEYTYNELKKQIRAIIETIKKMQMTFAWQWKHIDKNQKPAYKDYILKQMEL